MSRRKRDSSERREYNRDYQRRWYADPRNTELHKERVKRANARRKKEINTFVRALKSKPCMDCGQTFDPDCMDFDHREAEEKLANVADLANGLRASWRRVLDEIAKCDVVCACCHRLRTKARREAKKANPQPTAPAVRMRATFSQLEIEWDA